MSDSAIHSSACLSFLDNQRLELSFGIIDVGQIHSPQRAQVLRHFLMFQVLSLYDWERLCLLLRLVFLFEEQYGCHVVEQWRNRIYCKGL